MRALLLNFKLIQIQSLTKHRKEFHQQDEYSANSKYRSLLLRQDSLTASHIGPQQQYHSFATQAAALRALNCVFTGCISPQIGDMPPKNAAVMTVAKMRPVQCAV